MKKIIAAVLTLCILLSAFAVSSLSASAAVSQLSASAAGSKSLTENEEYRTNFINALLNRTSLWKKDDSYTSYYFMDLDLDGKNEFVVWNYGGTSRLHYTHIFAYVGGNIVELTESTQNYSNIDPTEFINTETFRYYFNKTEHRLMILGTFVTANGVGNYTNDNYDITFDVSKKTYTSGFNMAFYSGLKSTSEYSSQKTTMTYYEEQNNGTKKTVSEKKYNEINDNKLDGCVDLNMTKQSINAYSFSKMTASKKRTALEESYDAFYCDWFIMDYDTNHIRNTNCTQYDIQDQSYRSVLVRDILKTDFPLERWKNSWNGIGAMGPNSKGGALCHGLSLAMCYVKTGDLRTNNLSISDSAKCFGDFHYVSIYNTNITVLKDVVMYYQLTQYTENGQPSHYTALKGWYPGKPSLSEILQALTEEAKKSQREHRPFVLGYCYDDGSDSNPGHSVVVCGYRYNENDKKHEVIIYDPNSSDAPIYRYFRINRDYSDFSFRDMNAEHGNYDIKDCWTVLKFWDIEKVYGGGSDDITKLSPLATVSADNTDAVYLSADKKLRFINDKGQYLVYDGVDFTGNMSVYDCELRENADGTCSWKVTVAPSSNYRLICMEAGCSILGVNDSGGYYASAEGPAEFLISGSTITATGTDIGFEVAVQPEGSDDFISFSGESEKGFVVKNNGGTVDLKADGELTSAKVTSYVDDSFNIENVNSSSGTVSVSSKSGEVIGNPYLLGDADSDGSVTILDATRIQRYIAELTVSSFSKKASDADQDGEVTILDATAIQRHLAGLPTNKNIASLIQ